VINRVDFHFRQRAGSSRFAQRALNQSPLTVEREVAEEYSVDLRDRFFLPDTPAQAG
jgi:hypothetical protein